MSQSQPSTGLKVPQLERNDNMDEKRNPTGDSIGYKKQIISEDLTLVIVTHCAIFGLSILINISFSSASGY